ncbi:MAG: hybrid sensor histidine kinase/response regulator [Limisphaerales bacterium]
MNLNGQTIAPENAAEEFPREPANHNGRAARILVVDDQPANIRIVGSVLGALGFEIISAFDGPTALKRLALRTPDLILLDLMMPEMDGCEVCIQIKKNPTWNEIPIVFLSASDDKELIVRALDSGGVDYITKPFNQAELVSRVRTQLALKSALDHLKQLAEDKDELQGILAHDLKNYLGGIQMSAELMNNAIGRFNDARLTQLAENILRSSSQSLAFLKEFLANSAADYAFTPNLTKVNLAKIAANVIQQHQEAAHRKNLEIKTDFLAREITTFADASALEQILDNLLSNAIKFSPPEKRIFVTVRAADKSVECVIRDEGPGFSDEDKAKMFRRYGRLSARPTAGEPSTGLGLSIVHKLALAMNGELICESSPGNGAEFTVRLPVVKDS